ncbi:MAG: hypothetical protein J5590_07485 [Clostridia bacterium]|nr:hypothetical protein [Clostridia bacterium]
MRKHLLPLLLCIMLVFVSACSEKPQETGGIPKPTVEPRPDPSEHPKGSVVFGVINMLPAESDIYYMSLKPASDEDLSVDQEHDLLKDILKNGKRCEVAFLPEVETQYWNLSVKTENGNTYTWQNIELGTFSDITLMIGDNGPEFTLN